MDTVSFIIAVSAALLSTYTFFAIRLGRMPKLRVFRFAPDGLVVDDDFDTLHVYTDADFIVTNLSDRPNTVIRLEASANLGDGWIDGVLHGTQLSERTETRTDYSTTSGKHSSYNEIVRQWVDANVCPIMLSPQASGIPNQGISLRLDFQSAVPITDLTGIRLRVEMHDQYGRSHTSEVGSRELPELEVRRFPKFYEDESEIGRLKDHIPTDDMDAVVRVVYRRVEPNLEGSTLSVRRYYPVRGGQRAPNVSHMGRDGYAYNQYALRGFRRALGEETDDPRQLGEADAFRVSFSCNEGLPETLHVLLPDSWAQERLDVPIPEEFARLCVAET